MCIRKNNLWLEYQKQHNIKINWITWTMHHNFEFKQHKYQAAHLNELQPVQDTEDENNVQFRSKCE